MLRQTPSLKDIIFRPAKITDFEGVLNMEDGYEIETDFLPDEFETYFSDPLRFAYVATYQDQVVSFTSGRIIDNGETYETFEGRSDIKFRGLNLFELMFLTILREEVLPKWPNLQRTRMVTGNIDIAENRPNRLDLIPNSKQVASALIWKMPVDEFSSAIAAIDEPQRNLNLMQGSDTELEAVFKNKNLLNDLFPNKVLLRDSEAYTVGPAYTSNVRDIFRYPEYMSMFIQNPKRGQHGGRSLSFGSAMPMGTSKEICRYWVDFYGDAKCDIQMAHFCNHAKRLQRMLPRLPNSHAIKLVTLQFALPIAVYQSSAHSKLTDFFSTHARFKKYFGGEKRNKTQVVVDYKYKDIMKRKS